MSDRDKVISRLQIIRTWAEVGKNYNGIQGDGCLRDVVDWIDDALVLLKDQEPRVLTDNEIIKTTEVTTCYLEVKGERNLYGAYLQKYDDDHTLVVTDVKDVPEMIATRQARLWSAKPTNEQREATPWQD